MAVVQITGAKFEEEVMKSKLPVLVDFHADWCGPCKMAEPVLEELAKEYSQKLTIVKVDVDKEGELAQKYNVMSIPTTILFKDGKVVDQQTGFSGKKGFEELIKKGLK